MNSTVKTAACAVCGKAFRKRTSAHLYCSQSCARQKDRERHSYSVIADKVILAGAAELLVAADLMRRGLVVYQNTSKSGPADLIAWLPVDRSVLLIDVKGLSTGYRRADGTLSLSWTGIRSRDPKTLAWRVVVFGSEIHYPVEMVSPLKELLPDLWADA
jgi:predicted nucleic acid-binding Zn ribbon protein